ncbi:MAG: D-alanyl-D-alanine carboxypeptidase [Chitinispirillaceae bacterium]|nr:D-alanyl-D-alanine carboxypeptidase [Chitinispirillaceae bacterium]
MRLNRFPARLFVTAVYLLFPAVLPLAGASTETLKKITMMVENGSIMLNDENGAVLVAVNPDTRYIPASIIKILTATIALDLLGPDFRFKTECYTNCKSCLVVKGFGDPYLISDELRNLARGLRGKGLVRIDRISLDHTFFSDDLTIPGISKTSNPYDALNGALVVNFNTVNVGKDASGTVFSAEEETPLTPLAIEKAASLPRGTKQRINLSSQRADCNRYAGELLLTIFREQGVVVTGNTISEATADSSRSPFYTHYNSRPLQEVLRGLLKYSNNFIANQIFLAIGAQQEGAPATMLKSKAVFEKYIRTKLHIPETELVMAEGSGISRDDRVTGNAMISIMERFRPHAALLTPKNGHPLKSGTLNGVNNYAGYIKTEKGLRPFVIMLNQEHGNRDTILKLLEGY